MAAGQPVRVHEGRYVLGMPSGWYNVAVIAGWGPVAVPDDVEAWVVANPGASSIERTVVVDLDAGVGLALDHVEASTGLDAHAQDHEEYRCDSGVDEQDVPLSDDW